MESRRRQLEESFLFKLKDQHLGYRICPWCGADLEERLLGDTHRMVCSKECGFIFYENPAPGAGAIIATGGKILLVQRDVQPKVGWWCLPAGFVEWREHPAETAVREVAEETGLKIELTSLFEVYSGNDHPSTNAILVLYLASIVEGTLQPGDDARDARFFGFDELPDQIAFLSHRQALEDYQNRILKAGG